MFRKENQKMASTVVQVPAHLQKIDCALCGFQNHPNDVGQSGGKCGLCHKPLQTALVVNTVVVTSKKGDKKKK